MYHHPVYNTTQIFLFNFDILNFKVQYNTDSLYLIQFGAWSPVLLDSTGQSIAVSKECIGNDWKAAIQGRHPFCPRLYTYLELDKPLFLYFLVDKQK